MLASPKRRPQSERSALLRADSLVTAFVKADYDWTEDEATSLMHDLSRQETLYSNNMPKVAHTFDRNVKLSLHRAPRHPRRTGSE